MLILINFILIFPFLINAIEPICNILSAITISEKLVQNWNCKDGFAQGTICSWEGIGCNAENEIISLKLDNLIAYGNCKPYGIP